MNMPMNTLDFKFDQLTGGQRRTAHLIAQGRTDEYLANASNIDLGTHCTKVMDIFSVLRVTGVDYGSKRKSLVELSRKYFNLGDAEPDLPDNPEDTVPPPPPPALGAPAGVPDTSSVLLGAAAEEQQDEEEEVALAAGNSESATLPDVEALIKRINKLSAQEKQRLKAAVEARKGDIAEVAKELGLAHSSLNTFVSRIYIKLGLAKVPGRKKLVQQAFKLINERMLAAASAREAAQKLRDEPVSLAAPPPAAPVYEETQRQIARAAEAPISESAHAPSQPHSSGGFGAGVVIPIPADAVDLEVLSGEFTRNDPSAGLKAQILAKKSQGLRPQLLVLYPSPQDPTVALGHVVFFRKEGE